MNEIPPHRTAANGEAAMRALIRRDMLRANTAVAIVLGALLALALAAALAGLRAAKNQRRAEAAEVAGREQLGRAYLAQARAMRVAAEPGRRSAALSALRNAAAISRPHELRTEAIACLALSELEPEGALIPTPRNLTDAEMDQNLEHFAYADPRGKIFIYRARTKDWTTLETGGPVRNLSFSPDGKLLTSKSTTGGISVWDLEAGRALGGPTLRAQTGGAFLEDSRRIVFSDTTNGGRLSLYDTQDRRISTWPTVAGMRYFRVTRDLRKVAVANGLMVDVFDGPAGTNITTLPHAARVSSIAWSPDGRKLAVSCEDGDICLWDLPEGGHRILSGHTARCATMGFSPDGSLLYSSSQDGKTRLWSVPLGRTIATGEGIAHGFTPDGKRLGFWRPWAGFGVWRVALSDCYSVLPCDPAAGPLFTLDLSASGRWCVATQNQGFRLWDLGAGVVEFYYAVPEVLCVRVSADEKSLLVCRHSGLEIWPLAGPGALQPDSPPAEPARISLPEGAGARAAAISRDGRTAAVELTDRRMAVLDLAGNQPPVILREQWRDVNFKGPASPTGAGRFALSPDGKWLVTGFHFGADDVPRVWNARTGELTASLDADTSVVGFSPDGRWLGLAGMEKYSVWSAGDWRRQTSFDRDEVSVTLGALAFLSEEGMLAVARTRQIVQLRGFGTRDKLADLISPSPQSVNSIRYSAAGELLATATASDMVEIWRLGKLRSGLAALGLDWNSSAPFKSVGETSHASEATSGPFALAAIIGGFALAAGFTLLTLQRHRRAVGRLVVAEATAIQQNHELDTAKVELMHSQKMQALGTLAAGIAHDFNNLLSVIRMSGKLIGREAAKESGIQEHVADIEQAVLQGKAVVGSMLGYAGEREGEAGPVDICAVVEDVVSLLRGEFLSGIALTLELDRDAPRVGIGRAPLEQILLNLVVNASEAMSGEGRLKIAVHARAVPTAKNPVLRPAAASGYVEMTVADSGPGIAPELRDRLFEPFFTTKRSGSKPGTGLGLSLVYSLAQQGAAGLSVETGPGQGAAFTLAFPAASPEPVRETHSAQAGDPP